jgi:hypothetical protein
MDIEEAAQQIRDKWNNKTLAQLKIEAERENTGTANESLHLDAGQRLVLMMCLTDIDQIQTLERGFELRDDGTQEDWNTLTLGEVFRRTVLGSGIAFESLRDEYGRRSALVICAADPEFIERLYLSFNLLDEKIS